MTVAAESDFQLRPVILRTNQASLFRQLSVRGCHLNLEELLAQFCAKVALQTLANFRVHRTHFLTGQCATPVSICQSICERLFVRTKSSRGFITDKLIKKLGPFQPRRISEKDYFQYFFVSQLFRKNHGNVARDCRESSKL